MTILDELKQELGHEVTKGIVQFTFIVCIAYLCFQILLEYCTKRVPPAPKLKLSKSILVCNWLSCACIIVYFGLVEPKEDPEKASSDRKTRNFIMICGICYLFLVPLVYNYLHEDGWIQDDDTQVQPRKKSGSRKSDEEKEEDYVLPKDVRKRRPREE